jgi:RNA polymerase sigma factor (sigma-70 family)
MSQHHQWFLEARAGSDAAFARLVAAHQAEVRAFLRRMLGGGWAEADDVAQDVFFQAWLGLQALRDPAKFRSWLMGMAWRKAQDHMRMNLRRAKREREWLQAAPLPQGVSSEERLALEQALAGLSSDSRACVALVLAEGWTHAEVAEALSMPLGTVKSHVTRGRQRLLEVFGGAS